MTTLEPTLGLTTFSSNGAFAVHAVNLLAPKGLGIELSSFTHCVGYPKILLVGRSVADSIVVKKYRGQSKAV